MKRAALLLLLFFINFCSTSVKSEKQTIVKNVTPEYITRSKQFITRCETDVVNSSQKISKQQLISSLSHLNIMDKGGKHYYLLEKASISAMLNGLSAYPYSQCMLINKQGKIVYTMYRDEPFGKQVSYFQASPIVALFNSARKGEAVITDVIYSPQIADNYNMYFSQPVLNSDQEFEGVIVCAVAISNLAKELPRSSKILNSKGLYSYHSAQLLMLTKDNEIKAVDANFTTRKFSRIQQADGVYIYQPLKYKNIEWFVIIKEQLLSSL